VLGSIAVAVASFLAGSLITYFIATRFSQRFKLIFQLDEVGTIAPSDLGLDHTSLRTYGRTVQNLTVLDLTIRNASFGDLRVEVVGKAGSPGAPLMPRIDFTNFEVLGVASISTAPDAWIPIARSGRDRRLYINVYRIKRRTTAHYRVVGTNLTAGEGIDVNRVHFFPGALHNVHTVGKGLLSPPYLPL
jgi:hypothetical protein